MLNTHSELLFKIFIFQGLEYAYSGKIFKFAFYENQWETE